MDEYLTTGTLVRKWRKKKFHTPKNETGDLVTTGRQKAEVLDILFVSIFTGNCSSHISWEPKPQGWGEWRVQGWVWAHCATPTSFSSMPALLLRKVFFWSMINCPGCVPFQCLCHPQAPDWGREEALALCKHCSAIDKTLVWYQCYSRHKSKTHHHMGCWREYQPHLSQTTSNLFRSSV